MKKLLLILTMLFLCCSSCLAEQQEWIEEDYNFGNIRSLYIDFNFNSELKNGIVEKESQKIFKEKFVLDVAKKLKNKNISVNTKESVEAVFQKNKVGSDLNDENLKNFIKSNNDLIVCIDVQDYRIGSSYVEGRSYSYNVPKTSWVYGPNGSAMVTTNETQVVNVPGGNRPTVLVRVRFDVIDPELTEPVWSRIDDRSRVNEDEFDNSKPRDVYGRILKDFKNDFIKKISFSKNKE